MKKITLVIDHDVLEKYNQYYFEKRPKARKPPIKNPHHESINKWMIMKRPMMNALKQKWKDFIVWFVEDKGYSSLAIERCKILQRVYFYTNRRHDVDNTIPKFILDGLVEGGMLVDDDHHHITRLSLEVGIDKERPRTELIITDIELKEKNDEETN